MVERPSRRLGGGRETFPAVWKWLGDPPKGPEVVRNPLGCPEEVSRPSRRSGNGRETLAEVRKWSEDPPGGPKVD